MPDGQVDFQRLGDAELMQLHDATPVSCRLNTPSSTRRATPMGARPTLLSAVRPVNIIDAYSVRTTSPFLPASCIVLHTAKVRTAYC